jgi:hypothetical protein
LLAGSARARADLVFNYNPTNTFSGTAPAGSLTATFTDVAGGVQLVLTSNLAAGENLDPGPAGAFYFNFAPTLLSSSLFSGLNFTLQANTGLSEAAGVTLDPTGKLPADGGGYYDILLSYSPGDKPFTTGESQTYLITSSGGTITSADFNFPSTPHGGNGTWLSAIHVQNTPNGGSGSAWVAGTIDNPNPGPTPGPPVVPEPASLLLGSIGACLALLPASLRKFRRRGQIA